jgi:hypothetical protein
MNKIIVVLANSKKPGGRCLAGKELISTGAAWKIGGWIRPVMNENSGAVPEYCMITALGHLPELLEIIDIPLVKPTPIPDQPENWLLESPIKPKAWKSRGCYELKNIEQLLDKPEKLWNEKLHARRVKNGYVPKMEKPASLYLIKPDYIQSIQVWSESNQYGTRTRRRIWISHAKILHELDIDDVDFQKKYYPKIPAVGEPAISVNLTDAKGTIICVSLTPEFKDHNQYKIAAAFFEPPQ